VMATVVSNLRSAMPTLSAVAASVKFIDVPAPRTGTLAMTVQSTLAASTEQFAERNVAPPVRVNTGAGGLTQRTKVGSHGDLARHARGDRCLDSRHDVCNSDANDLVVERGRRPGRGERRRAGIEALDVIARVHGRGRSAARLVAGRAARARRDVHRRTRGDD